MVDPDDDPPERVNACTAIKAMQSNRFARLLVHFTRKIIIKTPQPSHDAQSCTHPRGYAAPPATPPRCAQRRRHPAPHAAAAGGPVCHNVTVTQEYQEYQHTHRQVVGVARPHHHGGHGRVVEHPAGGNVGHAGFVLARQLGQHVDHTLVKRPAPNLINNALVPVLAVRVIINPVDAR